MMVRKLIWLLCLSFVAAILLSSPRGRSAAAEDVLTRSRATYEALKSYEDTGVVLREYGYATSPSRDRHAFKTVFSYAPRGFYFEFNKEGGDRYVIWGDPDAFHTWWKTTSGRSDYPNPNNIGAFSGAEVQTIGSSSKIPSLLYSKASLPSDFANFTDVTADGDEDIGGHKCHRLVGTARDVYAATERAVNVRKMIVWIDADSLLIRKVVEEWKPLPEQVNRTTTMFEPQANPSLDVSRFKFTPP